MRAVVFDMDGVVIDSERHWRDAEREFLSKHLAGSGHLDQAKVMGLSLEGFYQALTRDYGLKMSLERFRELYRAMALRIYEERSALMPGFRALVDALARKRVPIGIASSSPREWVDLVVDRFELRRDLKAIATADEVGGRGKPDPAVYLAALERLAVDGGAAVAIEDSRNGVRAAKAAGMRCVALRNGFNDEQDLSAADLEVRSLAELDPARLELLIAARK